MRDSEQGHGERTEVAEDWASDEWRVKAMGG
jgi:hypothetical protein